jgi:hypothetical protein
LESFLTVPDYGQRIQTSSQEFSTLGRPQIRKWLPYSRKITIDDSQYPFLASGNISLQALPLAGQPQYGIDLGWGKIDIVQPLDIHKRHLGQGESVYTVTLGRATKILTKSNYVTSLSPHQAAFRMPGPQINGYHEPGQTGRLKDNDGIGSITENTLLQLGQSLGGRLETEAIT